MGGGGGGMKGVEGGERTGRHRTCTNRRGHEDLRVTQPTRAYENGLLHTTEPVQPRNSHAHGLHEPLPGILRCQHATACRAVRRRAEQRAATGGASGTVQGSAAQH